MDGNVDKKGSLIWTSTALILFALFLTAYSAKNPSTAQIGSVILQRLLNPFQKANAAASHGVFSIWDNYIHLIGVHQQNEQLKTQLNLVESENSRLRELRHENNRLNRILNGISLFSFNGVVATVIGYNPTGWVQSVNVNRGSADGVAVGQPVIYGDGVVGQVVSVAPSSSQILLAIDHASGVDAIVQRSRARGVVSGSGIRGCKLRYVELKEDVAIGDLVITSGLDGVYPKGLSIGYIEKISKDSLFYSLEVAPKVNFRRLESVFIITRQEPLETPDAPEKTEGADE